MCLGRTTAAGKHADTDTHITTSANPHADGHITTTANTYTHGYTTTTHANLNTDSHPAANSDRCSLRPQHG